MNSLCSSMIAAIFAITFILSYGVIMSQARVLPSSSLVSKTSQSLSHSYFHREGQKSTQKPHVAASLSKIPPRKPNPTVPEVAANLRRIPPSRPNPTQNKLKPKIRG
ncbi:unnamed protein product [Sphenostylis stenocarpa]|uniref:Uncharacterized protein n=1 Tax=Sphenostylis stenocarpa TaxID=92480 RepID=A0AA86W4Z0_9FABA|nr:unnamed protein product [Sphenostylis stenocarpa]